MRTTLWIVLVRLAKPVQKIETIGGWNLSPPPAGLGGKEGGPGSRRAPLPRQVAPLLVAYWRRCGAPVSAKRARGDRQLHRRGDSPGAPSQSC
jgi:hypothetical protein